MNSRMSPTPKLLPWLAKKAGIDMDRATVLWRAAERQAARGATAGSPEFFRLAMDRLLALVAEEVIRADTASLGWRPLARAQWRLWSATISAIEHGNLLAARGARLAQAFAVRA